MHHLIYKILFVCLSIQLVACSSSTTALTNYYLLTNEMVDQNEVNEALNSQVGNVMQAQYLIEVQLPEYLQKPYLVMQLNENKIHYAMFHLWAEPLNKGVGNALLFDLNTTNTQQYFILSDKQNALLPNIVINIDYFHISEQGYVVLAGQFNYQTKNKNVHHRFAFKKSLTSDGYSHAVSQMRDLISQLSKQIIMSL